MATPENAPRSITNLYASSISYSIITLIDGALRAIVLLFLVQLKFSAIALAIMFALYEAMGIVMNFSGGILGATYGMRFLVLMSAVGQTLGIILLIPLQQVFPDILDPATRNTTVITVYVVISQMISGVSKDLMKIQGKSVPKLVTKDNDESGLFKIISILTGLKNSIKGFGYLFGSLLLFYAGWIGALCVQLGLVVLIFPISLRWMENDLGISKKNQDKARITCGAFKKGYNVNVLSLARFFLFGSRDVWFEVAAPYFFRSVLMWAPFAVGGFMAGYTIIYGQLQALTSQLFSPKKGFKRVPNRKDVVIWSVILLVELLALSIGSYFAYLNFTSTNDSTDITVVLLVGICVYAAIFAVNSAVHSYLIVSYSGRDKVAMDVGFYYMSNAGGRCVGTLISGFIYTYTVQEYGVSICLFVATGFCLICSIVSRFLRDPKKKEEEDANAVASDQVKPVEVSAASMLLPVDTIEEKMNEDDHPPAAADHQSRQIAIV